MSFSALILFSTALQECKNASYRLTSVGLGLCWPDMCSVIDLRRGDKRDTDCASELADRKRTVIRQACVLAVGNAWLQGVWGRKEGIWEGFMQPGWLSALFHSVASERVVWPNTASNASLCYFSRPWRVTRELEPPILHSTVIILTPLRKHGDISLFYSLPWMVSGTQYSINTCWLNV